MDDMAAVENRHPGATSPDIQPVVSNSENANVAGSSRPIEQMEVDEGGQTQDDFVYPTGPKVWITLGSLYAAYFLNGLDLAIVAVAVPSITNDFKTVDDIGWYSAAYAMVGAAFIFFFGKATTLFRAKHLILFGLANFVTGSAICTFAQHSRVFIFGRALCGFGIGAIGGASITTVVSLFPLHKRTFWLSMVGTSQAIGLSCAPVIGGLLIDRFSWRGCFGINLPLCPILIGFIAYFLEDTVQNPNYSLPLREKIKRLDLLGTVLVVPAITSLLMALQWGGIKYGWHDIRIIILLVVFAVLGVAFAGLQYYLGEKATIPLRIARKRSMLAAMWFSMCSNGILATTEYYISIYWQGVRGETATKSGLLSLSMILGLTAGGILAGVSVPRVGYFTPFMFGTSVLAPIASGLLTTIDLDSANAKVVALLGFLGFAVGLGNVGPYMAISTILTPADISIGNAIAGFGGGMGSALFVSTSATLFQNRLFAEVQSYAPGTNTTMLEHAGLSDIRNLIGKNNLRNVLSGYDKAVTETLYLPLGLAILTLVGSALMEWPSVKKKQT